LEEEWKKSLEGHITPDCREGCLGCGVCDDTKIAPITFKDWRPRTGEKVAPLSSPSSIIKKYRIAFAKRGHARFFSHLELVRLFTRAFKRAGLNILYSQGHHPMPKISFASALPVGTESLHETVDVQLCETLDPLHLMERIREQLPSGIDVSLVEKVSGGERAPKLRESHFDITMEETHFEEGPLVVFLKADKFPVSKKGKKGEQIIDAKTLVKSITLRSPHSLRLVLAHIPGPELRPVDIIQEIFHLKEEQMEAIKVLKVKQVL